jgi:Protein of unknown function (DUF3592)
MVHFLRNSGMIGLALFLFAGCALCGGFKGLGKYRALAQLEEDGVPAPAEVADLREKDTGDKGQVAMVYFVTCRFRVADDDSAESVERELQVDEFLWRSFHKGDAVTVRYSRSNPAVWDVPDGRTAASARFGTWVCFTVCAITVAIILTLIAAETYVNRRWPEPRPQAQQAVSDIAPPM